MSESNNEQNEKIVEQEILSTSKKCNCRHSKCIKLYCECYQANVLCDSTCHCFQCQNNPANEVNRKVKPYHQSRNIAMRSTLIKNPSAFQPKIQQDQKEDPLELGKHSKGCACRKSGCMKKYCECFQAKVPCSLQCKCSDCKNFGFLTRDHFLKSTVQNEDFTKQNFLCKQLLTSTGKGQQSPVKFSQ